MRPFLNIHLSTMAFESRKIRADEVKYAKWIRKGRARKAQTSKMEKIRESMHGHRRDVVRLEARISHLAAGFLRGTPYSEIESTCRNLKGAAKSVKTRDTNGKTTNTGRTVSSLMDAGAWKDLWTRVETKVLTFGIDLPKKEGFVVDEQNVRQTFSRWLDEAKDHATKSVCVSDNIGAIIGQHWKLEGKFDYEAYRIVGAKNHAAGLIYDKKARGWVEPVKEAAPAAS